MAIYPAALERGDLANVPLQSGSVTSSGSALKVPEGWPEPAPDLLNHATEVALHALSDGGERPAVDRLTAYYRLEGNYAGVSFAELQPTQPGDITATDLFATSLLSVDIGPRATRRLLDDGPHRQDALNNLARIDPSMDLSEADAVTLARMEDFYRAIKTALSSDSAKRSNPWVTASKLCARKRPSLFPVRDRNVCDLLGLTKYSNYQMDWQVFQHLITNPTVYMAIDTAGQNVRDHGRDYRVDQHRLRVLDAALWTYTLR